MVGGKARSAVNRGRSYRALAALVAIGSVDGAYAGPAIGQLEIKSLNMVPGRIELQSQNAFGVGNPGRAAIDDNGDIEADDNSIARVRAALEAEYTINSYLKTRIGIEYEQERLDELTSLGAANEFAALQLDEYELEGIVVLIPRSTEGLALGLLVEYEHPAEDGGARTLNYGPIVEWISGQWIATFNPSLVSFFGGDSNDTGKRDDKIDFRYAARIMYRASDDIGLAVEAYGTVERVGSTGSPGEEALLFGDFNQHRLGPVIYWALAADEAAALRKGPETEATIGLGILAGLNKSTPDAMLKLSLELEF